MAEKLFTRFFGGRVLKLAEAGSGVSITTSDDKRRIIIDTTGSFSGDVTIGGNLTVLGTTTTVESTVTTIDDNIIILNDGEAGAGVTLGTSGIEIERGTLANVRWVWDETGDYWTPQGGFIGDVADPTMDTHVGDRGFNDARYLLESNNLSDLVSAPTARTNLGVAIGSDVQAWDANLDDIAALSDADSNFIVGSASGWVVESGTTVRTSLGLAIGVDVAAQAHVGAGASAHAAATTSVNGFMSGADKTKLDGIETGATADQTAADIRGLGFFDTTNDGTGSGLDADLLDGLEATAFAPVAHVGAGGAAHATVIAAGAAGFMSGADKTKLDGIEASAKDDQDASEVPFTSGGSLTSTDVGAALDELETLVSAGTDDQTAVEVPYTPGGSISSTNVQDAIDELDTTVAAIPGGTVTSVGSGVGLSGGPVTTAGTLDLDFTTVTPGTPGVPSTEVFVTSPPAAPPALHVVRTVGELAIPAGGFLMGAVVDDGTPVLGGDLDVSGGDLVDSSGNDLIAFVETGSAVNEITVTNAATAGTPKISATGSDTDVDLDIEAKGAGSVNLSNVNVGSGTTMTKLLSATAALDFPSMSDGQEEDLTITVTGAVVGDSVALGMPAAPTAGVVFTAFVSAAGTVTVRASNFSGVVVDPTSGTFRATVFQF